MITEGQYLDALKTVRDYIKQVNDEMDSIRVYSSTFLNDRVSNYRDELSKRTFNAIMGGMRFNDYDDVRSLTFGDLQKMGRNELWKMRNMGKKSMDELIDLFESNGESLN